MLKDNLKEAVVEAREFIRRAKAAIEEDSMVEMVGGKETGAVKRQSMELTRSLVRVRRP